jgi:integrase
VSAPWSAGELEELLAQLPADRAARCAFIVGTSAEWGATERARREDVSDDQVRVRGTKRETRDRVVPLVFPDQRALVKFALEHGEGTAGLLFAPWANVRRDLLVACERITEGLRKEKPHAPSYLPLSPNDLRRSFAHWMSGAGLPNEVIAPLMGHRDTRMLDRVYNQKTPGELARAMARWGGLESDAPSGVATNTACRTGAATKGPTVAEMAFMAGTANANPAKSLPRGGVEPPTRGFSVPCSTG